IDKSDKDLVDELRAFGCHVLVNDLHDNFESNPQELLDSIFSIGNIAEESNEEKATITKTPSDKKEESVEKTSEVKPVTESKEKKTKPISQLLESPEEAGSEKIKEKVSTKKESEEKNADDDPKIKSEKITKKSKKKAPKNIEVEDEQYTEEEISTLTPDAFISEEDEEWIDTVARGIQLSFYSDDKDALEWLSNQSKFDTDNEVQIAGEVMKSWVESKSNVERRKGAGIVSSLAKGRRETYLQIMQRLMVTSVIDSNEDRRRRLIQIFNVLNEVDGSLSEALVREITKNMAMPPDDKPAILERSKLSIVQLVIHSRRLTKVSINELLNILDKENPPAAQIWNILTTFDAGMVAIELVTNFSIAKTSEIIRKANFLRFTGSVYTILQEVIKAWQSGDINAIGETTGAIIPEETLRKFERLELARKVQKLKMVQLSALAESLNKDVETVERLVTELIVNDELKAEMKLVDDKMYLVANGEETKSSNQ
ncbi:MAG: hypothetical protein ACC656_03215, partial [Candidatus Heimdallarchaeota archaeon]